VILESFIIDLKGASVSQKSIPFPIFDHETGIVSNFFNLLIVTESIFCEQEMKGKKRDMKINFFNIN
jgi:hypothetical protein